MKTRIAAAVTALVLGVAPISSAMAFGSSDIPAPTARDRIETGALRGLHEAPDYDLCPSNSAAEGNANQQTRPVKQYGQVSGGYRC